MTKEEYRTLIGDHAPGAVSHATTVIEEMMTVGRYVTTDREAQEVVRMAYFAAMLDKLILVMLSTGYGCSVLANVVETRIVGGRHDQR